MEKCVCCLWMDAQPASVWEIQNISSLSEHQYRYWCGRVESDKVLTSIGLDELCATVTPLFKCPQFILSMPLARSPWNSVYDRPQSFLLHRDWSLAHIQDRFLGVFRSSHSIWSGVTPHSSVFIVLPVPSLILIICFQSTAGHFLTFLFPFIDGCFAASAQNSLNLSPSKVPEQSAPHTISASICYDHHVSVSSASPPLSPILPFLLLWHKLSLSPTQSGTISLSVTLSASLTPSLSVTSTSFLTSALSKTLSQLRLRHCERLHHYQCSGSLPTSITSFLYPSNSTSLSWISFMLPTTLSSVRPFLPFTSPTPSKSVSPKVAFSLSITVAPLSFSLHFTGSKRPPHCCRIHPLFSHTHLHADYLPTLMSSMSLTSWCAQLVSLNARTSSVSRCHSRCLRKPVLLSKDPHPSALQTVSKSTSIVLILSQRKRNHWWSCRYRNNHRSG